MNFRNLITVLAAVLLLFVIERQDTDVSSHELIIADFDTATDQQADIIIQSITHDLKQAGISKVTLEPVAKGSLLIRYESNLSPAVVLELFNIPSSKFRNNKSVKELLGHADLSIVFKDAVSSQSVPYGCDGTISFELKTDIDRQATKRLSGLAYCYTEYASTNIRDPKNTAYISYEVIYTQSHVFMPDSRAGPSA